jgi:diguanylate cyclase (GGDEF)-like protein/PAS domain S-box-containing protein
MASLKPFQLRLVLAFLAAIILVLALYVRLRFLDREQIGLREDVEGIIRVAQKVVKEELDRQHVDLERFAQRMGASPADQYWQTTAATVLNEQKGILALGYVDKSLGVRWITPPKYADSLVKTHEEVRNNRPLVLNEVLEKGRMRMSDPVQVADMGRVFLAYYPVNQGDKSRELMVAVLHLQVLVDSALARVVPKDYAVALMDGYTEIYSKGSRQVRSQAPEFTASLPVGTAKWGLRVWPSPATIAAHKSDWPEWVLWGGAILAVIVMALACLPMNAREDQGLRPASTPAEWSRRWESALKESAGPEPVAGAMAGGRPAKAPPQPDREIDLAPRGSLDENVPWVGAIAHLSDAVFITETESMAGAGMPIVYVNEAFTQIFGYPASVILSKTPQQLHGAQTDGKVIENLRTAQTKRLPLKSQVTFHDQAGKPVPGTLSMRPVTDSMGRPTHWIFMHHPDTPVAIPVSPVSTPAAVKEDATVQVEFPAPPTLVEPQTALAGAAVENLLKDLPDLARVRASKMGLPVQARPPVQQPAGELPVTELPAMPPSVAGQQPIELAPHQADPAETADVPAPHAVILEAASHAMEPVIAQEPVAHETVAHETLAQETVAHETVAHETLAQETVAQETVAQETVAQETVAQETVAHELVPSEPERPPQTAPAAPVLTTASTAVEPAAEIPASVGVSGTDALEMLIESSPLAMMGCDLAGKITLWNGAAERMLGWREDEVLGRPAELLPAGFLPTPAALKLTGRNRVFETDVTRERKDGARVDLSVWAAPLRDNSAPGGEGEVFSWIIFLADISDRKSAERSLERRETYYRSLLDATGEVIAVVEVDSTIRYLNPAVQRVLGYGQEELIGAQALDLVKPADRARVREALTATAGKSADERSAPSAFEVRHKDGTWRTLESSARPMPGAATLIVQARDITGEASARGGIVERTGLREQVLEQVSDGILALDAKCCVVSANPAARRLFDWRDREVAGLAWEQTFAGWTVDPPAATVTAALVSRGGWSGELRLARPEGSPLVLEVNISAVGNAAGERTGYLAIHRDITERKSSEEALRASEERYALAARSANDGLWDWNLASDEIYYSPRWKTMLGYEDAGIANMPDEWFMLVHPADIQNLKALISKHLKGQTEALEAEYRIRRRDGQYIWMQTRAQAVRDGKGRAIRMVGSQSDISEQKAVEDQLLHEAFHDSLTGLPNRVLFVDRLGVLLDRARHGKSPKPFAVLFLDVDRFKYVNDSLGHLAGDEFLIEIGRRLQSCLSESDTIARHGGDEFTILLDNVPGAWAVQAACEKIQKTIAQPMIWQGQEIYSSVSIGSTISTLVYERPDEMVRDADTALYQAKSRGRGRHVAFDKTMHAEARQHLQLEADLRRALERREFQVVYQPLIALGMGPNQGRLAGFEALLRWQHPKRGLLTPEAFMVAAEETGLILDIDRWVMREACGQMKRWSTEFPNAGPLHVNVNFSGQHFQQLDLAEQIRGVLKATSLNPEFLRIELTEKTLVKSPRANEIFRELKEIKVQLNLDDFGSGHSSLSHLSKYPIDRLKIDKGFIKTMTGSAQAGEIIRGILLIARNLRINVIAEGVETAEQLEKLRAFGCEFAQGYHISQPLDPETATRLIASNPRW